MSNHLKQCFYYMSKFVGLFWLSRILVKKRLRILCYHGFSLKDEEQFVPGLFIKVDVFTRRMKYLKDNNYNIITLKQAYRGHQDRNFPDDAVVITVDDGFYSVFKQAAAILKQSDFPSTLYLTSYYFDRNSPIFPLAVDYMFWKTTRTKVNFAELNVADLPTGLLSLPSKQTDRAREQLKACGQRLATADDRQQLLKTLGRCLDIDFDQLNQSRILNLINENELQQLLELGMDIQLHTHRHDLPTNLELARYELEKNKEKINALLSAPMTHFCYPSGEWSKEHWPLLEQQGVMTATTCHSCLVTYNTPRYSMGRILDSSRVSQIEFEAEISGYNEMIRKFRK